MDKLKNKFNLLMNKLTIHTIVHNNVDKNEMQKIIDKNEKKYKDNKNDKIEIVFKVWNENKITKLIKSVDDKYIKYYNKLIINKSKEDFAKYLILYKHGGLYVNNLLLKCNRNYNILGEYVLSKKVNILFIEENESIGLERGLLKKESNIINDDIIYISEKDNELILYVLNNINYDKIPQNQYQTKLQLGNYFLTNQVNNFYFKHEFKNVDVLNYSVIPNELLNIKYKKELYPNTIDLINPAIKLSEYSGYNDILNYMGLFGVLLFYLLGRWDILILYIIVLSIGVYFSKIYIYSMVNYELIKAKSIENDIFYDVKDYPAFKEMKKHWKDIKKEAENVLKNSPKLDISRDYEDWHNSEEYVNKIKNEHGWIKSWKYKDGSAVQDGDGNHSWLNYGLLYFGTFFTENTKSCPITTKILEKIKDKINICGFSYLMGNTTIEIHSDETGPENNSMAMHLGLIVPKNPETCRLIMKIGDDYCYENEQEGKFIVFDATNEHYAYNQSNEDRVVLYIDFKV